MKTLVAGVCSKVQRVLAVGLADSVECLVGIAGLSKRSVRVVAETESTGHGYKRHSFPLRSISRGYAQGRVRRIRKTLRRGDRAAGILH